VDKGDRHTNKTHSNHLVLVLKFYHIVCNDKNTNNDHLALSLGIYVRNRGS